MDIKPIRAPAHRRCGEGGQVLEVRTEVKPTFWSGRGVGVVFGRVGVKIPVGNFRRMAVEFDVS